MNVGKPVFTSLQLSLSTAEEELSYLTGARVPTPEADLNALLPSGLYRVMDGELRRIVPGLPPKLSPRANQ